MKYFVEDFFGKVKEIPFQEYENLSDFKTFLFLHTTPLVALYYHNRIFNKLKKFDEEIKNDNLESVLKK